MKFYLVLTPDFTGIYSAAAIQHMGRFSGSASETEAAFAKHYGYVDLVDGQLVSVPGERETLTEGL